MSNDLIPSNIQVPAHVAARMGKPSVLAQNMSGGLGAGEAVPRISIKGSRFRIVEDGTETVLDQTVLDTVIVGANPRLSKNYYAKAWDPDAEATGPDCFSMDGVRPDPSIAEPQNNICASCTKNAWGSKKGPQGQDLKACADQKRLAVIAAEDPAGPVYLLQVTPAALKGLKQFQKELERRGIPPETVKTRITFDTNASFPKLVFKFGGFIDAETQALVDPLFDSPEVRAITAEYVGTPPAPSAPEPKQESEPPKASGFGRRAQPEPEPEAKPESKVSGFGRKTAEPAKVVSGSASSLSDEIAALLGGDSDD
jgi:hypothetical protein